MKHYCSRRGCFKLREEAEMMVCPGKKGKEYFCRDTDCYGKHLKKQTVRTAFNKDIYARNFSRY